MENFEHSEIDSLYIQHKSLLFGLAYRMMGTVSEAEDVIQDVYIKIQAYDLSKIRNGKSFLMKVTTNRCLDQLKSAHKKREVYVGPWLPEPMLLNADFVEPESYVIQKETLAFALMILLQQLNPVERAVLLLREVFGYEYCQIAEMINKAEANCRKINSRAKASIDWDEQLIHKPYQTESFVHAFIAAIQSGEIEDFVQSLSKDAVVYTDSGGKINAAVKPIVSRDRISRYLIGILCKASKSLDVKKLIYSPIQMNGEIGLAITYDEQLMTIVALNVARNQVHQMFLIFNPDKLNHAAGMLGMKVQSIL